MCSVETMDCIVLSDSDGDDIQFICERKRRPVSSDSKSLVFSGNNCTPPTNIVVSDYSSSITINKVASINTSSSSKGNVFSGNKNSPPATNIVVSDHSSSITINKVASINTSSSSKGNGLLNKTVKTAKQVDLIPVIEIDDDDNEVGEDIFREEAKLFVSDALINLAEQKGMTTARKGRRVQLTTLDKDPLRLDQTDTEQSEDSEVIFLETINAPSDKVESKNGALKESKRPINKTEYLPKPTSSSNHKPHHSKSSSSTKENLIDKSRRCYLLLDLLVEQCKKANLGSVMGIIEKKVSKYGLNASNETTVNDGFIELLEKSNDEISKIVALSDIPRSDKVSIINKVKVVLQELKRDGLIVDKKLITLYRLFAKLQKRIEKLEEMEVESDDEMENPYVLLGRYKERAAKVYNKICELEQKAPTADRQYLQRFTYVGKGPVAVQRAMERYYNATRKFPNFKDVLKVTKKVNDDEKLKLSPGEVNEIAQQTFTDFGKKLKLRRQMDDYHVAVGYLPEGQKDPALFDIELREKLAKNKHHWETKEQEVIDHFARKQHEKNATHRKEPDEHSESEGTTSSDSEDEPEDKSPEKQDLSDSDEELSKYAVVEVKKRKELDSDDDKSLFSDSSSTGEKRKRSDSESEEKSKKLKSNVTQGPNKNVEHLVADKDADEKEHSIEPIKDQPQMTTSNETTENDEHSEMPLTHLSIDIAKSEEIPDETKHSYQKSELNEHESEAMSNKISEVSDNAV